MSAHESDASALCYRCGVSFDIHEEASRGCLENQSPAARLEQWSKVADLSAALNRTLQQPLRNEVLRVTNDVRDLAYELQLHNQQGKLDLEQMLDKVSGIEDCARELRAALELARSEGHE